MPGVGGSSAKTDRTTQLFGEDQMKQIGSFLSNFGKQQTATGTKDTKTGLDDTEKASKYYSDILSGDPAKVLAAVAPEVKSITGQADQQKKAIGMGGNRSGGTNETAQKIGDKARGDVTDVIAKAKPGAAAGVERTGSEISRVGLAETGQGLSAENSALSAFTDLAKIGMESRGQSAKLNADAQQQWAQAIGDVLQLAMGL